MGGCLVEGGKWERKGEQKLHNVLFLLVFVIFFCYFSFFFFLIFISLFILNNEVSTHIQFFNNNIMCILF